MSDVKVLRRRYPCCNRSVRFTDPTIGVEVVKDCPCGKRWSVTFEPLAIDLGALTVLRPVWTRVLKRGEK